MTTQPSASTAGLLKQKLEYSYDAMGRRIQKKVSVWNVSGGTWNLASDIRFLYDGWNLQAEFLVSGTSNLSLLQTYVWGQDLSGSMQGAGGVGGLLFTTKSGSSYATGYDGNGNIQTLINLADGTTSVDFEYDPFGTTIKATGPAANVCPFGFSTKYTDTETGMLYYGFRYYNSSTGRWLSRDPIQESGGTNLYGFVKNAPTSSVDPLGQESWQINEDNCTMEMTWNVRLRFVSDYNDWTDDRMNSFKTSFVQGIEHDWNSSNIAFVPKDPTGKCCKKCPKGFRPRLKINLVDSSNADWSPRVWPNTQGLKDPFNNTARPDVSNLNEASNSDAFIQYGGHRSSSHEFGHSIGLMHPGYYRAWQISRWGQNEYHFKGTDYFGHQVDGDSELMGAGNGMRTFYYEKWKTTLNAKYPDCPYEIISSP